jgi:hypothetical protein
MRAHIRAQQVHQALHDSTRAHSKGSQRTRGVHRLVMTSEPGLLYNVRQVPVGVQVQVRLFEKDREVPIDPDRRFVNPPLMTAVTGAGSARNGGQAELTEDPVAALWDALWDSVTDFPNPAGWRP